MSLALSLPILMSLALQRYPLPIGGFSAATGSSMLPPLSRVGGLTCRRNALPPSLVAMGCSRLLAGSTRAAPLAPRCSADRASCSQRHRDPGRRAAGRASKECPTKVRVGQRPPSQLRSAVRTVCIRVGRGPEAPEARGARNRRGVPWREAPHKSPRR